MVWLVVLRNPLASPTSGNFSWLVFPQVSFSLCYSAPFPSFLFFFPSLGPPPFFSPPPHPNSCLIQRGVGSFNFADFLQAVSYLCTSVACPGIMLNKGHQCEEICNSVQSLCLPHCLLLTCPSPCNLQESRDLVFFGHGSIFRT